MITTQNPTSTATRPPIPDTRPADFSTMLNQAAAALADCLLGLTETTAQATSGQINPLRLKQSKAAYMSAQAALMQSRAVESSLRALAQLQKIQENHKPAEEPRDYAAEARMVEMWALADDADRTARINARVRLAAEAKYANAKTDAEIDELGRQSLVIPEEDETEAIEQFNEPDTQEVAQAFQPAHPSSLTTAQTSSPNTPSPLCSTAAPGCDDTAPSTPRPPAAAEALITENPLPSSPQAPSPQCGTAAPGCDLPKLGQPSEIYGTATPASPD